MIREIENAIVRFSGDSGDGMQLVGNQFSNTSAAMGNDISTFPDYPAEIRAPAGTIPGVSGFQVNIGSVPIYTPGDEPDVLVAMNPAALKANVKSLKRGGTIIVNSDAFDPASLKKANYTENPLKTGELQSYQVIEVPITTQTLETLKDTTLGTKEKLRCKNFYALGIVYFMYGRELDQTVGWLNNTMGKKKPEVAEADVRVLKAGYNFGETIEGNISTYTIPAARMAKGKYRHINGNTAVAWGLMCAAEASGRKLFLGSYPITPATEVLQELSVYKNFGVKTFQAEDEISGICSAIGAAYAGALAATNTSGPGLALKCEASGLAIMLELPLVIVDVQRGGPSTGLPTKTEQSDLNMAIFGRNGESPLVVVAASSPSDCFQMSFEAARIALEHMTPVILLTDSYIANGAEPWKIPDASQYKKIKTKIVTAPKDPEKEYLPYERDENLVRPWAIPGTPGYEHQIGGLEKANLTGNISYDPENHQNMVNIRAQKVQNVANDIPLQKIEGDTTGDLLVISWGGTHGAVYSAVKELQKEGKRISHVHLRYIHPYPKNLAELVKGFTRIIIPELNSGQLLHYLNNELSIRAIGFNKVQGIPFKISELSEIFRKNLENIH